MNSNHTTMTWWPMHLAFWLPLTFAVPLFVALNNRDDVIVSPLVVALVLAMLTAALTSFSAGLAGVLSKPWQRRLAVILLASGLVLVLQGNLVHELFYYGEFNGSKVDWRVYGFKFWLELVSFCVALPLIAGLLFWLKRIPPWVPWLPAFSCGLMLAPIVIGALMTANTNANQDFDSSVFEFSREKNLIHLLPDGFQGDLVREVLDTHPELARALTGFTLFTDNLGMYQGTAPSVPALLTGRPAILNQPESVSRFKDQAREHSYQNQLSAAGFQMDYVGESTTYCVDEANSCVVRSFNDLKSRGYFRFRGESLAYAIRLVADLTLFRLSPMYLKERIYNNGNWLFSDTTVDGSSPFPDPVIREWTEHMQVVDGPPRFKWYHYIGTHMPAQWNRQCQFLRDLDHNRENAAGQTYCVLSGLVAFLDRLRELGIYDQTAMVISGDHGTNLAPDDLVGLPANASLYTNTLGHSRPALLVKTLNNHNPITYSSVPTSVIDVAPTALSLVDLSGQFDGQSVFEVSPQTPRTRHFHRYDPRTLWRGEPVPYTRYAVEGPANVSGSWRVESIYTEESAPSAYPTISDATIGAFARGLQLNPGSSDQEMAWLRSSQLAFLIQPVDQDRDRLHHLRFSLHIPKYIQNQRAQLKVNGRLAGVIETFPEVTGFWRDLVFEIPGELLVEGNNFLELDFAVVGRSPENPKFLASALITSISLE